MLSLFLSLTHHDSLIDTRNSLTKSSTGFMWPLPRWVKSIEVGRVRGRSKTGRRGEDEKRMRRGWGEEKEQGSWKSVHALSIYLLFYSEFLINFYSAPSWTALVCVSWIRNLANICKYLQMPENVFQCIFSTLHTRHKDSTILVRTNLASKV